jgi:hypothetical protein
VIDWSRRGAVLPTTKQSSSPQPQGAWVHDFVTALGKSDKDRKPNDGLRLKLPSAAVAIAKGLSKLTGRS